MTQLDTLRAALLARAGKSYITQFTDYFNQLTSDVDAVGSRLVATSTTSETIGTGSRTLTVQTEKLFAAGQLMLAFHTSTPANFMVGTVVSYDAATGALAFTVAAGDTGGSGTIAEWTVTLSGRRGATGATGGVNGGTMLGNLDFDGFNATNIGAVSATTLTVGGEAISKSVIDDAAHAAFVLAAAMR